MDGTSEEQTELIDAIHLIPDPKKAQRTPSQQQPSYLCPKTLKNKDNSPVKGRVEWKCLSTFSQSSSLYGPSLQET